MRLTRKLAAVVSEDVDNDTTSASSIIRLGNISELVEGSAITDLTDSLNAVRYSS
jgi:hypothetical protein